MFPDLNVSITQNLFIHCFHISLIFSIFHSKQLYYFFQTNIMFGTNKTNPWTPIPQQDHNCYSLFNYCPNWNHIAVNCSVPWTVLQPFSLWERECGKDLNTNTTGREEGGGDGQLQPWAHRDWKRLRHNVAWVTWNLDIRVQCKHDKDEA